MNKIDIDRVVDSLSSSFQEDCRELGDEVQNFVNETRRRILDSQDFFSADFMREHVVGVANVGAPLESRRGHLKKMNQHLHFTLWNYYLAKGEISPGTDVAGGVELILSLEGRKLNLGVKQKLPGVIARGSDSPADLVGLVVRQNIRGYRLSSKAMEAIVEAIEQRPGWSYHYLPMLLKAESESPEAWDEDWLLRLIRLTCDVVPDSHIHVLEDLIQNQSRDGYRLSVAQADLIVRQICRKATKTYQHVLRYLLERETELDYQLAHWQKLALKRTLQRLGNTDFDEDLKQVQASPFVPPDKSLHPLDQRDYDSCRSELDALHSRLHHSGYNDHGQIFEEVVKLERNLLVEIGAFRKLYGVTPRGLRRAKVQAALESFAGLYREAQALHAALEAEYDTLQLDEDESDESMNMRKLAAAQRVIEVDDIDGGKSNLGQQLKPLAKLMKALSFPAYTTEYDEVIRPEVSDSLARIYKRNGYAREFRDRDVLSLKSEVNRWYKGQIEAGLNPAVSLVLPLGGQSRTAVTSLMPAAQLLSSELEELGVPVEVLMGTTQNYRGGESREDWVAAGRPHGKGRVCDLSLVEIKSFDDRTDVVADHYAYPTRVNPTVLKDNPDGEITAWAAQRLVQERANRHYLVTLTGNLQPICDTSASVNGGQEYLIERLRTVLRALQNHHPSVHTGRVELVGKSNVPEVAQMYDETRTLDSRARAKAVLSAVLDVMQ